MNSRYIRTTRTKVPRHRRSRQLAGSFEDSNRWIKCWNCGFVNDRERLTLSDRTGIEVQDFDYEDTEIRSSGDALKVVLTLDTLDMEGVILENGPDGTAITDYYSPRKPVAVRGCSFCGCTNLP